jgi:hypothetical protein
MIEPVLLHHYDNTVPVPSSSSPDVPAPSNPVLSLAIENTLSHSTSAPIDVTFQVISDSDKTPAAVDPVPADSNVDQTPPPLPAPKKRGRPKKNPDIINPAPKKRGRPKKNPDIIDPVSKKRGRPKKNPDIK